MSQQTTLYRVYDQAGLLLYVGISKNALKRFGEHSMSQPWWGDGTTVKMQHYPTRAEALAAEEAAIKSERPAHNKTFNKTSRETSRETAKRRGIPTGKWLRWICDECRQGVADDEGYVWNKPGYDGWSAVHYRCDPDADVTGYWIGVERLRTRDELNEFREHLIGKRWFSSIEFDRCIRRASSLKVR